MKYLATALFKIDPNKFFDIFSLNNKEVLFFSTKQFELKSGRYFKMANKSDFTIIVEKIKTTKPLFMDYFCSQLYTKFSILISNALDLEQLFSTIKDTMVPNN